MVFWAVGTFYLLLLLFAVIRGGLSGGGSSSHCSPVRKPLSWEAVEANDKAIQKAMEGIELPAGRRIKDALYLRNEHEFLVEIEWNEDGEKFVKYIKADSVGDMEKKIKDLTKLLSYF